MGHKQLAFILIFALFCTLGIAQDVAMNDVEEITYTRAFDLAYDGDRRASEKVLLQLLAANPKDLRARSLLASTLSWKGKYAAARKEFNQVTSVERSRPEIWISAIKNELYAKEIATALGLANKALFYLKSNPEVERLRQIALQRIETQKYPGLGWYNTESKLKTRFKPAKKSKRKKGSEDITDDHATNENTGEGEPEEVIRNRFSVRNSFTIFDQRYEPILNASISLKHKTKYGSIIPAINYSNRNAKQGLQYDLSLYPKLAKRMYAFVNYGYSDAPIYPNHRFAGDVYLGLPGAIEVSAGGRFIMTDTRNVSAITNSLGHYRGNYYFSLRSYITPRSGGLTRFSGNLLVRKYLRDSENYFGGSFGMGFSPELRQLFAGDELLAETLLYVESQRLSLAYQFTPKKSPNIYRTNISLRRQEIASDSGNFFWAVSAGLTYNTKF